MKVFIMKALIWVGCIFGAIIIDFLAYCAGIGGIRTFIVFGLAMPSAALALCHKYDAHRAKKNDSIPPEMIKMQETIVEEKNAIEKIQPSIAETSAKPTIKYCRKCGRELVDGSNFCSYCGADVIKE